MMDLFKVSAAWACLYEAVNSGVQLILSFESLPATASSRGARSCEQSFKTRERTLYAPINDRKPDTVPGSEQVVRVAMLCGLAY